MSPFVVVDGKIINVSQIVHARKVEQGTSAQPQTKVYLHFLVGEPISVSGPSALALWDRMSEQAETLDVPPADGIEPTDHVAAAESAALAGVK